MEVSHKEEFLNDIEKQGTLGFSQQEIIENLRNKGATDDEIREMKSFILKNGTAEVTSAKQKSGGAGIFSILISILFIIRGIAYIGNGKEGFGILFLTLGAIGLVAKLANRI